MKRKPGESKLCRNCRHCKEDIEGYRKLREGFETGWCIHKKAGYINNRPTKNKISAVYQGGWCTMHEDTPDEIPPEEQIRLEEL